MKYTSYILSVFMALFLMGCGTIPQAPIALDMNKFTQPENRVGIFFELTNKPTTNIYGAGCLLCYGVASASTGSLDKHLETLALDDINNLQKVLIDKLESQDKQIKIVEVKKKLKKFKSQPDFPDRDFRELKEEYGIDSLIVVNVIEHGAFRSFNGYVATSDPMGFVKASVYTVDLTTNKYIQYDDIEIKVNVNGNWDEAPSFPGVTGAYYEAIEKAKEAILLLF